jgi:hypothetical protein
MRVRRIIPALFVFFVMALIGLAAEGGFVASPVVDGKLGASEYRFKESAKGMDYAVALSADGNLLTVAIKAQTGGWVALGFGSRKMDGSWIVMGYETSAGAKIGEMLGKGHFYGAAKESRVLKSAVQEEGGTTVLEVQVKAATFVKEGKLALILAFGKKADFLSIHSAYLSVEIDVTK